MGGEIIFVPYWRFRGMSFSCEPFEVKERVIDTTILASRHAVFPPTMGLRPQAIPLRLVTPGMQGTFLTPDLSSQKAVEKIGGDVNAPQTTGEAPRFPKIFIGETVSLMYAPFALRNGILRDAILDHPLASLTAHDVNELLSSAVSSSFEMSFLPTLCPHCGWDLKGEKESLVLTCSNCDSAWEAASGQLRRLKFSIVFPEEEGAVYLPFWKINVECGGITLCSYADLARFANLPLTVNPGWEREPLSLWLPAFKVNPAIYLRLAGIMTLHPPGEMDGEKLPEASLYPVTLPMKEALEAARIVFAHVGVPKKTIFPRLQGMMVRLKESLLVYLPFQEMGGELIQPRMNLGVNRSALGFGKSL